MKSTLLYLSLMAVILISCKKESFEHESPQLLYPCTCCELTDTIVGQYTGQLITYDHSNWSLSNQVPGTITLDTTITINITRNLSNTDFIEDSLVCWFDIPHFFDTPITVSQNNGHIEQKKYNIQRFEHSLNNFQIKLLNGYQGAPSVPGGPNYFLTTYIFVGTRQ